MSNSICDFACTKKNIKIFLILVKYYEMKFFEWPFEINYSDANSWKHAPHKYFFNTHAVII